MSMFMEFNGKSIDDAIDEACDYYSTDRAQLEIEIISDAKSGIFGLVGSKDAVIKARMRDSSVQVKAAVTEVVERLVGPIIGEPKYTVTFEDKNRYKVEIDDEENSGLLIGKEGQTLSALQYLVNRILALKFSEPVRVRLDAGDYRQRQEENLRKTARDLAKRAKTSKKPQTTKPLSSYHRRIVHMALQDDKDIKTRSRGEGAQKRVLILPKGKRNNSGN